jgi:hypothetical protein
MGFVVAHAPIAAAVAVLVFLLALGALALGRDFVVAGLVAVMPWMVIFNDLLPDLLKTLTSAAATIALCLYVAPIRSRSRWLSLAIPVFIGMTLYGLAANFSGAQAIQAGKYLVFPFLVLAVTSTNAHERLPRLLTPVLVSTGLAALTQLGIIVLGLGAVNTYYHVGERLGFDGKDPLELGLMSVIIAGAGLASARSFWVKGSFVVLGALAAFETGERTAFIASLLVVLIFIFSSRFKISRVPVVIAVAAVLIGGGALAAVENRVSTEIQTGEFSTVATAGSGRGEIYTVALSHYFRSGPQGIILGTGLGSINRFEEEAIGVAAGGHSDVIKAIVELGVIGFAGWLAIWVVLLTDASLSRIILVPIAVTSAISGSLTTTAPLVVGLFFAAASSKVAFSELVPRRAEHDPVRDLPPPMRLPRSVT